MKKVLLFGTSGEIGGRIANLAVKNGHKVYGVARGNTKPGVDLSGVERIQGDKYDESFLASLADTLDFDVLIDTIPNQRIMSLYAKYFPNAENIFVCGSTGVYVPLQYFPADEKHPWREETPYNFFMQSQWDIYALDKFEKDGFPVTIFRPTNIIGEGHVPLELWGGRNIEFFKKLKRNEPVTIAHCEDILVQSGYNWDLASAFVLALDHCDKVRGEIFNISCKHAVTLGEYLSTAMKHLKSSSEIVHVEAEKLPLINPDVKMRYQLEFLLCHMCFDVGKAERILGYSPKVSTQEGLVRALSWCEKAGLL